MEENLCFFYKAEIFGGFVFVIHHFSLRRVHSTNFNKVILTHFFREVNTKEEKLLEKTDFTDTVFAEVGPCIGIHTGPGAHAYIYLRKKD